MKKHKNPEENDMNAEIPGDETTDIPAEDNDSSPSQEENIKVDNAETDELKAQLDEKTKKCEEYLSSLQRITAEFDNYKKRTVKEKEALYSDTVGDVVTAFLPVMDNMERAIQAASGDVDAKSLKDGIDMVFRQLKGTMDNLGVEEIKGVGEKFDPHLHNAVMHIDDDSSEENVVVEVFQKGYMLKDKVIRHSMVKVAN